MTGPGVLSHGGRPAPGPARRPPRGQPKPRKLHMTPKQIEDGPVICGLCNAPFEVPEDSDQDKSQRHRVP
jgi:hypothetical protein